MNKVNNPKISVLMACFNSSKTIKESIDSVLDQTFRNFEFLIIDDGSSDDTFKKLQNYKNTTKNALIFVSENLSRFRLTTTSHIGESLNEIIH